MALTRSALREKGVTEKEILDYIMEEHGNGIEAAKEKAKETAEKPLQKTIDELQAKVDSLPKVDEGLQAKYDAEIEAHRVTKETLTKKYDDFALETKNKEVIAAKQSILHRQLAADGANPKLIKLLEKEFDLAGIEIDGEGDKASIKGWDKLAEPVKAQYAEVFGKVQSAGVTVSDPPPSQTKTTTNKDMNSFIRGVVE